MLDQQLLRILACPKCKSPIRQEDERLVCQNPACGLRYPIRNGLPIMLVEEAEQPAPRS